MVEQGMITKALEEYHITDAALAKLKAEYMPLIVKDVNDKEGYDLVHTARMNIKGKRVEVEKTRKKLKEDALEYGRAVDKEAKRITALLEPIEGYLERQEEIVTDELARIKAAAAAVEAARIQARTDKLYDMGLISRNGNFYLSFTAEGYVPEAIIKTCPDDEFNHLADKFQQRLDAENARIEKEKTDKLTEEKRLASIRAEQEVEAKRLSAIAKEQADKEARIKATILEIEAEKQRLVDAEKVKQKAIADAQTLANAKQEAAKKAIIETEARIKREAEAKTKAEAKAQADAAKKAARAPDKEKLLGLIDLIGNIKNPIMKTQDGEDILAVFNSSICQAIKELRGKAEAL